MSGIQLRHLLDLKQKQANLSEAWSSRTQAEESSKLSEEAIKQGRSIMLFTVVTIIFVSSSRFGTCCQCTNFGTAATLLFLLRIWDEHSRAQWWYIWDGLRSSDNV